MAYRKPEFLDETGGPRPDPHRWLTNAAILVVVTALILIGVFVMLPWVQEHNLRRDFGKAERLVAEGPAEDAVLLYQNVADRADPGSPLRERAVEAKKRTEDYLVRARTLKDQADDAFKREQFVEALNLYKRLSQEFGPSRIGRAAEHGITDSREMACQQHQKLAREAASQARWDAARSSWEQVLALAADYAGASDGLAQAKQKLSEFDNAMAAARASVSAGDWQKALAMFRQARAIMPFSAEAYDGRTLALKNIPPPPGMVLIEPGDCVLGPGPGRPQPAPARMDGFYIDATEVTISQFSEFNQATGRGFTDFLFGEVAPEEGGRLPMTCVSWRDAADYAAWAGKRLPTADEWERAARGKSGRPYPWGDAFDSANGVFFYSGAPVGSVAKDRTEEGCFDMAGNVAEWTADKSPAPSPWPPLKVVRSFTIIEPWRNETEYRIVCGESWAGFDAERPAVPVLAKVAKPEVHPSVTIFADKPGLYGAELIENCETFFLLRDVKPDYAVFEIRKWVEDLGAFATGRFTFKPGDAMSGRRIVTLGSQDNVERRDFEMASGWRLVEILPNLTDPAVVVESTSGARVRVGKSRRPPVAPQAALPQSGSDDGRYREVLLKDLGARSLSEAAALTNRRIAPAIGRYANIGFRCVIDIP